MKVREVQWSDVGQFSAHGASLEERRGAATGRRLGMPERNSGRVFSYPG